MPVDTVFLEKVLNQSLSANKQPSVVIKPVFDFLEEIIRSPSQKQDLKTFMEKWKSCLHKSSKKMMLVTIKGIWPPSCLDKKQLCKQPTWKEFIRKYDSDFVACTVNSQSSPDYQPLNFSELIRQTFWKEIYENFGNKIVQFLFDKCAILYEADEGLYLIIAHSLSPIYKKISRFTMKKVAKTATPFAYKYTNPYQITDQKQGFTAALVNEGNDGIAVENKDCDIENQVHEENAIRAKEPKMKRNKLEPLRINQDATSSVNRWICPRPEILNKVIEHRNATLITCNLPVKSINEQLSSASLRYICIQKDEVFKPTDKLFVIKQKAILAATKPKISKSWQGLKLPDNLTDHADSKGHISVEVFFMSETLAKKLEIRVKPKGRQKKSGSQRSSKAPSGSMEPSSINSAGGLPSHSSGRKILTPVEPDNSQNSSNNTTSSNISRKRKRSTPSSNSAVEIPSESFVHVKPYILDYTLPISACLYNKSSWSKWPPSHCLSKAIKAYATVANDSKIQALKIVVAAVLDVPVSCQKTSNHLRKAIGPDFNAQDSSNVLNSVILDIIGAHSKFKDIHKLVKNCVAYWHKKYSNKMDRKVRKFKDTKTKPLLVDLTNDHDQVPAHASKPNLTLEENECIDLAESESITLSSNSSVELLPLSGSSQNLPINKNILVSKDSSINSSTSNNNICPTSTDFQTNPRIRNPASREALNENALTRMMNQKRLELVRKCSGNSLKKRSFKSLKHDVPQNCVMQTLKQIFHLMKLELLLGSKRNLRGFFKFVRKAVILGGIKSGLHLNELMAMINPYDMEFLFSTKDRLAVEALTAKLVTWLFTDYVLVLLKTCFYVTECNFSRFHVRFYLRESWISASTKMKNHLIQNKALTMTDDRKRPNAILRYIPKQNQTLRSLLLMKNSVWNLSPDEMRKLKLYLHYIDAKINESRMYLPAALQLKWLKFVREWKENGAPKIYYLRMDIRDAFPSVSIPKLNDILFTTGSERGHKILLKEFVLIGSNGLKRYRGSILSEMNREHWHSGIHIRPCIVMDLEEDKEINTKDIFNKVINIINTTNVVRVGKKSYQFNYGLPQGWSPSPTLCSIYYGYIDSLLYLPYLETNGRLFLRVVDDYLFLSPNPNEVLNLMQLMKIGCEKYGIKMNAEKSENNLFVKSNVMTPTSNCETVTFCGWNFCVICGHVSRDYKKYSGQDFTSTIGFQMSAKVTSPEQFIHQRATVIVPARLEPIVLNTTINCNKRILLTTYEASIVLAFRFYAICRVVYPSLNALNDNNRVEAVKETILKCLSKLARHVARSCEVEISCKEFCCGLQNFSSNDSGRTDDIIKNVCSLVSISTSPVPVKGILSFESLLYTSLLGFRLKLSNHYGVFAKVLGHLNSTILKLREKLGETHCDNVIKVVGTKIPECLSGIKI